MGSLSFRSWFSDSVGGSRLNHFPRPLHPCPATRYLVGMAETLTGVIERITFHNLDNGYCVLRVQARGHRDLVTVVGHLSQVIAGEFVEASGEWQVDRQHGQQF